MNVTHREHRETARAQTRALLGEINTRLDDLVGWAGTAGYELDRLRQARGLLRAEFNVLVVGHEESETGVVSDE